MSILDRLEILTSCTLSRKCGACKTVKYIMDYSWVLGHVIMGIPGEKTMSTLVVVLCFIICFCYGIYLFCYLFISVMFRVL